MAPPPSPLPVVSAETARRLLLRGQGLLADPGRRAGPAALLRQIEAMGFVQVDTISVVERAHHHIIRTRFDGYRPEMLATLLERRRLLFEHWTHDASIIPIPWWRQWRVRFERYRKQGHGPGTWWHRRMGGKPEQVIAQVLDRVRDEGPLMSKDFVHDGPEQTGPWWGWKPQKAALEYLWRTGTLAVAGRVNFHKRYELSERLYPEAGREPAPDAAEHLDWACGTALDRLSVATPGEIAAYFAAVSPVDARAWCRAAPERGLAVAVMVEPIDGASPRRALAHPAWERRAARAPAAPARIRLLSPFDPVVRDRKRAERFFGFDYRFEAFVPEAKRKYGYYVLPILEGDRLVGRLDPKLDRKKGMLTIRGPWWEPGIKATKARRARLDEALDRYREALGARTCVRPRR